MIFRPLGMGAGEAGTLAAPEDPADPDPDPDPAEPDAPDPNPDDGAFFVTMDPGF